MPQNFAVYSFSNHDSVKVLNSHNKGSQIQQPIYLQKYGPAKFSILTILEVHYQFNHLNPSNNEKLWPEL